MMNTHLAPVWSHLTQIEAVRGEGIYLYDSDGQQYIDFTCGIGVTNTGHCHPEIVRAIQEQAQALLFAQMNVVMNPLTARLAEAINKLTPQSIDTFFFSNSGAEATEAAVKLARHAIQKTNIIVFQGSFHGRTAQTMAMTTSKTIYRHTYQPLPAGIFVAPFPAQYAYGWDEEETTRFCINQLKLLLKSQTSPEETAAVVIEPILGEGGYIPAPLSFLRQLRQLCTENNILFIADEVQTGFGRTGKFFCYEHADIEPDIIIMAKGLGSGLPISGIAASHNLMAKWKTGTHGGTYGGGSLVVMAAALATVNVMCEQNLPANAARMGEYLMNGLRDLQKRHPIIGDVRGRGLMIGVEFTNSEGHPDKDTCKAVQKACLDNRLLLLTCGTHENIIRWIPPLIVNQSQIETALQIFETALQKALTPVGV